MKYLPYSKCVTFLSSFIFTAALQDKYCYCHSANENTEALSRQLAPSDTPSKKLWQRKCYVLATLVSPPGQEERWFPSSSLVIWLGPEDHVLANGIGWDPHRSLPGLVPKRGPSRSAFPTRMTLEGIH